MSCISKLDTLTREHFHNFYWFINYMFHKMSLSHVEVYFSPLRCYVDARIYQLVKQLHNYGVKTYYSCESMDSLYQIVVKQQDKIPFLRLLTNACIFREEFESSTILSVSFSEQEHDKLLRYLLNNSF